jgi:hypothetical protein
MEKDMDGKNISIKQQCQIQKDVKIKTEKKIRSGSYA